MGDRSLRQRLPKWVNSTNVSWAILLTMVIAIKVWSIHPGWVEDYYSTGVYPYIATATRWLTGWLPFSLGDIGYGAAGCWLLYHLVKLFKKIWRKELTKKLMFNYIKSAVKVLCTIYIGFNLLWGLNYNRLGIAHQLNLSVVKYSTEDLKLLTISLLDSLNTTRLTLGDSNYQYPTYPSIFNSAFQSYQSIKIDYPFLNIGNQSIKKSLYGRLGNWVGYLGYYNPFSGESQVNLAGPKMLVPFVTCHEIAHQLGYASESEANFTGFLAASDSKDPLLRYSCYFDMFHYANRELFMRDSIAAKNNYKSLNLLVKNDFKDLKHYLNKHKNPVEPIIKLFYDQYLKANQQSNGVDSYNEVTGWLIAYNKKYGKL